MTFEAVARDWHGTMAAQWQPRTAKNILHRFEEEIFPVIGRMRIVDVTSKDILVVVARPNVFGPDPEAIREIVYRTVKYRKMAHSAEDISSLILSRQYGYRIPVKHSDVKHGFVIGFDAVPEIDLQKLEGDIRDVIAQDLPIAPADEDHIRIGDQIMPCTGVRTHVKSSSQIECFRLLPELRFNPITQEYLLVGIVGDAQVESAFDRILKIAG